MHKIDQVTNRMRCKTFFYMNGIEEETYGLKTLNCPPKNQGNGII